MKLLETIIAVIAFLLLVYETVAWAIMGRISGEGWLLAIFLVGYYGAIVRVTIHELLNSRK